MGLYKKTFRKQTKLSTANKLRSSKYYSFNLFLAFGLASQILHYNVLL